MYPGSWFTVRGMDGLRISELAARAGVATSTNSAWSVKRAVESAQGWAPFNTFGYAGVSRTAEIDDVAQLAARIAAAANSPPRSAAPSRSMSASPARHWRTTDRWPCAARMPSAWATRASPGSQSVSAVTTAEGCSTRCSASVPRSSTEERRERPSDPDKASPGCELGWGSGVVHAPSELHPGAEVVTRLTNSLRTPPRCEGRQRPVARCSVVLSGWADPRSSATQTPLRRPLRHGPAPPQVFVLLDRAHRDPQ